MFFVLVPGRLQVVDLSRLTVWRVPMTFHWLATATRLKSAKADKGIGPSLYDAVKDWNLSSLPNSNRTAHC